MRGKAFVPDSDSNPVDGSLPPASDAAREDRKAGADLRRLLNAFRVEGPFIVGALKLHPRTEHNLHSEDLLHHVDTQQELLHTLTSSIIERCGRDAADPSNGWIHGTLSRELSRVVAHFYFSDDQKDLQALEKQMLLLADTVAESFKSEEQPDLIGIAAEQWEAAELAARARALSNVIREAAKWDWMYETKWSLPRLTRLFDKSITEGVASIRAATSSPVSANDESIIRRSLMAISGDLLAEVFAAGAESVKQEIKPLTPDERKAYLRKHNGVPWNHIANNFTLAWTLLQEHAIDPNALKDSRRVAA